MMRGAALLCALLGPCRGLKVDRQASQPLDDEPKLGSIGSQITQVETVPNSTFTLAGDGQWFGAEAAEAEAAAQEAMKKAEEAERAAGDELRSDRELQALDDRAVLQVKHASLEDGQMAHVADAMLKEGAAAERILADTERQQKKQEREEERQLAQLDKQIARMKDSEFDAQATLDWKEKARKAENKARIRAREEEKMEAHEKWLAQQELRHAARAVQEERELKRAYRQQRNAVEAEVTAQLWQQAEDLRSAAEKTGALLPREEVLQLLDIPDDTLTEMKHTISRMAHDADVFGRPAYNAQFAERLEAIRFKVAGAAAAMEEAVQHKARDFVNITNVTNEYDDQQYMMRLAWFLNDMKDEVRSLHDKTTGIGKRIQSWDIRNPEKMTLTMSLALDGVTDNIEFRNKFLRIDTAKLAYSNTSQACDALAYMFASNIHPAYESLVHMKNTIDNMSLVVASVFNDEPPRVAATMVNGTHALLNMAYAQNLAYKNTAQMLMTELVPSVMDRFHCESSGSFGGRLGGGFALAVLAAVVGWLSL